MKYSNIAEPQLERLRQNKVFLTSFSMMQMCNSDWWVVWEWAVSSVALVYYPAGLSDHSVLIGRVCRTETVIDAVLRVQARDTLCQREPRCPFQGFSHWCTSWLVSLRERSTRGLEVTVCESRVLTAERPEHKYWLSNIVPLKAALAQWILVWHRNDAACVGSENVLNLIKKSSILNMFTAVSGMLITQCRHTHFKPT